MLLYYNKSKLSLTFKIRPTFRIRKQYFMSIVHSDFFFLKKTDSAPGHEALRSLD